MRTGTENKIDIYLIRHGLTRMNEERRYIGTTDESLSEAGAKAVALKASDSEFLDVSQIDYVFSGPMKRVVETAMLFFQDENSAGPIHTVPEWTEIDFGDFEGKNYVELSDNPDYQSWIDSGGEMPFPNGEDRKDFIKRSWKGFSNVVAYLRGQENSKKDVQAACFMHGGNIMAIMYSLFGGEYFSYQAKPAEGYKVTISATGEFRILGICDLK